MGEVDLGIAVVLLFFAFRGYSRGIFHEIISLATILVGCGAALRYGAELAVRLADFASLVPTFLVSGISFLVIYLMVVMAVRLATTVVERLWVSVGASPVNRLAGTVFGAAKGAVVLGFMIMVLLGAPPLDAPRRHLPEQADGALGGISKRLDASFLAPKLASLTGGFVSAVMAFGDVRELTVAHERRGAL